MIAALSKHAQKSLFDGIWEAANACYLPSHAVVGELYSVCDNFSVEYQLPARNDMLCIAEFTENDHFFDLSWKPRNLLPVSFKVLNDLLQKEGLMSPWILIES